jgi:hypothetical protein
VRQQEVHHRLVHLCRGLVQAQCEETNETER